ncbi:copper resistance protein NlpE [Pollutibacter soli]|uniref:copper resistance protein NlpE n=1 Tax=Pollutibacter soli TaxID=3034157 RepID=UPI0030138C8A
MSKQLDIFVVLLITATVIYACQSNGHSADGGHESHGDSAAAHDSSHGNMISGAAAQADSVITYSGVIPCADCEGIESIVSLRKDFTFTGRLLYMGRKSTGAGSNELNQSGSWMRHGNTIHLVEKSGGATYYLQTDSSLIQVDDKGERIGGSLADKFVLRKQ